MIININKECGNATAGNLLVNEYGFKSERDYDKSIDLFVKDGKKYKFVSWNHFNGYIYDITLKEVK